MQTEAQARAYQKYRQSAKGKATRRVYQALPRVRAKANAVRHTQKGRAYEQAYRPRRLAIVRAARGLPHPTRPCPEFCEVQGCTRSATNLDHCHATGAFRGWLCGHHNRGMGLIGDTLVAARAVVQYLERGI